MSLCVKIDEKHTLPTLLKGSGQVNRN